MDSGMRAAGEGGDFGSSSGAGAGGRGSAVEEAASHLQELLEKVSDGMGVEASVAVRVEDGTVIGEYVGDDLGPLIGHHGQTIDAIQHLAYRIVFRRAEQAVRVVVDAAGYRERRTVALRATADQAAEAAIHDGRPVALQAMNALERRVVHEHLKSRHDVETYSEGQEPDRRLVVAPVVH